MKTWLGILFTFGLAAGCLAISSLIGFNLMWILVPVTGFLGSDGFLEDSVSAIQIANRLWTGCPLHLLCIPVDCCFSMVSGDALQNQDPHSSLEGTICLTSTKGSRNGGSEWRPAESNLPPCWTNWKAICATKWSNRCGRDWMRRIETIGELPSARER